MQEVNRTIVVFNAYKLYKDVDMSVRDAVELTLLEMDNSDLYSAEDIDFIVEKLSLIIDEMPDEE